MTAPEMIITRRFAAPRTAVWQAWTRPELLMKWWGPKDFTAPVCTNNLRIGGRYLFCMRAPEGQQFWSTGVYQELIEPSLLVCTDSFADESGNVVPASYYGMGNDFPLEMLMSVSLEEQGDSTIMVLSHIGIPVGEIWDLTRGSWNESFDKLALILKPG